MRMWRSSIPLPINGDSAGKKGPSSDSIPADMIYTRRGVSEGWFVCFPFACSSGSGPTWSLDKLRNFNKITSPHTLLYWQNTNFNLSSNNLRINIQFFMTRRRYSALLYDYKSSRNARNQIKFVSKKFKGTV